MTTTYSSTSYSAYPHMSHPTHPSLNKMVCHPLPQAYERKFSDSMYGAAFGFLLEAKGDEVESEAGSSRQVVSRQEGASETISLRERQGRPKADRRKSTQSERARVLPPQKPIPSQPVPLPPTCASTISLPTLPTRTPSPLKLDSDIVNIPHEENVFITLSPQHKSPSKACPRPSIVAMAPLSDGVKAKGKLRSKSTRGDSIWV